MSQGGAYQLSGLHEVLKLRPIRLNAEEEGLGCRVYADRARGTRVGGDTAFPD